MSVDPARIVALLQTADPIYQDPDHGVICRFCLADYGLYAEGHVIHHEPDCVWLLAQEGSPDVR